MAKITEFRGEYRFLSNFYLIDILHEGKIYPSVENAYQASKTFDEEFREWATKASPSKAKQAGKSVVMRNDWEQVKIPIMTKLVEQKFTDPVLFKMLADTKPNKLIEGNTWGDTFWGESPVGVGKNHLGKILMAIRDDITKIF